MAYILKLPTSRSNACHLHTGAIIRHWWALLPLFDNASHRVVAVHWREEGRVVDESSSLTRSGDDTEDGGSHPSFTRNTEWVTNSIPTIILISFKALPQKALIALCVMVQKRTDYRASNSDKRKIVKSNSMEWAVEITKVILKHFDHKDEGYYADCDLDSPGGDVHIHDLLPHLKSFT